MKFVKYSCYVSSHCCFDNDLIDSTETSIRNIIHMVQSGSKTTIFGHRNGDYETAYFKFLLVIFLSKLLKNAVFNVPSLINSCYGYERILLGSCTW